MFVPVCDSVANTVDSKSIRVFVEQIFEHAHLCVRIFTCAPNLRCEMTVSRVPGEEGAQIQDKKGALGTIYYLAQTLAQKYITGKTHKK